MKQVGIVAVAVLFGLMLVSSVQADGKLVASPSSALMLADGDYNGDGSSDIAVFRGADGAWMVRDVTRAYFGREGDVPVSGDYDGDGITDMAIFRSGLWAVRGVTRTYFGTAGDISFPGDHDGDGTVNMAIFRPSTGLWAARTLGRTYFGVEGDWPVSRGIIMAMDSMRLPSSVKLQVSGRLKGLPGFIMV